MTAHVISTYPTARTKPTCRGGSDAFVVAASALRRRRIRGWFPALAYPFYSLERPAMPIKPPLRPNSQLSANRVRILDPKLFVPEESEVQKRLAASLLIRRNRESESPLESLNFHDRQRAASHAKAWVQRKQQTARIDRINDMQARKRISELASGGAQLAGPTTETQIDEMMSAIHVAAPWLSEVTTFILRHLRDRLRSGQSGLVLPPIILVGSPGVSKSWLARELARLGGVPVRQIDVGGGTAGFRISGTEKGWGTACPGVPVETILATGTANPFLIVDEIDKSGRMFGASGNSSTLSTSLLQVLERGTAAAFECPCYRVSFDLSYVSWILTANTLETISEPLLDRARVFHIPDLTLDDILYHFNRMTANHSDPELVDLVRKAVLVRWKTKGKLGLRRLNRMIELLQADRDVLLLN
ncbi:AAA family ATPase [Cypionkella sp.]|uniref:AAA family ATPase n=1 Tax=Cypionkella sp. TaxID=2811411 RepID=UPI0027248DFC|nr:AAA family ATPase [Cypionkella sp.]MDO8985244.1 AAA family ATPase [Cypionkella sp.]MDP2051436.1 AAA family ATPase [Cypionkella sp.]